MGLVEQRILHAEALCDTVETALEFGTDHELALALRDLIANSLTTRLGDVVTPDLCRERANNLAQGLSAMIRRRT